jgi:hypothetical protein
LLRMMRASASGEQFLLSPGTRRELSTADNGT